MVFSHITVFALKVKVAQSCLTLQSHGLQPVRLLCPWNSPAKNIGVGSHSLLQRIFLTQGSNPNLLHWQVDSLPLSHQGSPSFWLLFWLPLTLPINVRVKVKIPQLCPVLCNPMDYSLSGSSVHGILQARILEWVAYPFSRGSSQPRNRTGVSCIVGRFFTN